MVLKVSLSSSSLVRRVSEWDGKIPYTASSAIEEEKVTQKLFIVQSGHNILFTQTYEFIRKIVHNKTTTK